MKAEAEVAKLIEKGHTAFLVEAQPAHKSGTWYRVRVGYFNNLLGAREYQKRLP
jgi:cell division protein FtsN